MHWDNKLQWQKYFKAIIESIWTSCVKIRGKIKMTILCKQRFMHVCQKNASARLFNVKTLLFSWNLPLNLCCTESNPQLTWCFACQWNMHVNWFHLYTSVGCWTWVECHVSFLSTGVWNSAKCAFQYANRTMRIEKEENNRERSNYSLYNRMIFMAVHPSSFQPHWAGLNLSGTLSFTSHVLRGCEICISNTTANNNNIKSNNNKYCYF